MRHYVRLQVSSLVTFCVCLTLTSALLTCVLTLMFSAPLERVRRRVLLLDSPGLTVGDKEDTQPHSQRQIAARSQTGTPIQREIGQAESKKTLIRHPKKNDLDPQAGAWHKHMTLANTSLNNDQPMSRAPQCILLGFAKCGTSALLEFLDLHSRVVSLDWEPDYFCDRMYQKYDLKWYVGRMPPSLPGEITIEKSPCYIVEHEAHLRIHAMNSSLKLLVLVRDPVTRLMSEHAHYTSCQRYWGKSTQTFEERFYNNKTDQFRTEMVLKVLIVDGDQLISDPLSQLSRIETFLGLDHEISETDIYFDREKGFYCMRHRNNGQKKCMGKSKGRQHESVSQEFKLRVADFLKPYKESFFQVVGERFDWM